MHEDLITGERALRNNAAAVGLVAADPGVIDATGFEQLPLGEELLSGADLVLLQLPRTLAELEEIAAAVARYAAPDVVLLAGGRIKHMSLGMNAVLERHFETVQPQLARQKSRIILARGARQAETHGWSPAVERLAELDLDVAAHGAVFAGRNWTWGPGSS
ncbi:ribosomal RNA large subunit methyltransferase G [Arthrobacter sp. Hiyo4]|nr:ribosomal RNA large subunit methyltransferase G [Arthrobacter sp. Hiyo4]